MLIDSYRFLPRSFRPLYQESAPFPGEEEPVWTAFPKRLSEARIGLLTSAGMYLRGSQDPFDLEREKREPEWGDPSWRPIPHEVSPESVGFAHLHLNPEDMQTDPEIVLPARSLAAMVAEGVVAGACAEHVSVMGFQERSLRDWRDRTAPDLIAHFRRQSADAVVLAPG